MNIQAPMPGIIIDVKIKQGDTVQENQDLFTMEAMKMEMPIVSPKEGKIIQVNIDENQSVGQDQVLALIE